MCKHVLYGLQQHTTQGPLGPHYKRPGFWVENLLNYLSFLLSVVVLVFPWKIDLDNSSTVVPRHWAALWAAWGRANWVFP